MSEFQDLQNHLQFQLSLLRLTKAEHGEPEEIESPSGMTEQEYLMRAIERLSQVR